MQNELAFCLNLSHVVYFNEILSTQVCFMYWLVPSWSWSYGSWIYNYLFNQCISPLKLWVRTSFITRCTTLCVC